MPATALRFAVAMLPMLLPLSSLAQSPAASAPAGAASAAITPANPGPNPVPPGTVEPQPRALPQVSIPLGKSPQPHAGAKPIGAKRTGGGIDDATARCKAQATAAARAECLEAAHGAAPRR